MKKNHRRVQRQKQIVKRVSLCISIFLFSIFLSFRITGFLSNAESNDTVKYYKYYTSISIQPGDSLDKLATKYDDSHFSSIQEFKNDVLVVNCLEDEDQLTAGMYLLIPYYSSEFK